MILYSIFGLVFLSVLGGGLDVFYNLLDLI